MAHVRLPLLSARRGTDNGTSRSQNQTPGYHTFVDYDPREYAKVSGIIVPQTIYQAPKAYVRKPSVRFVVHGKPGIRLEDALHGQLSGLHGGTQVPDLTGANRISCRVLVWLVARTNDCMLK